MVSSPLDRPRPRCIYIGQSEGEFARRLQATTGRLLLPLASLRPLQIQKEDEQRQQVLVLIIVAVGRPTGNTSSLFLSLSLYYCSPLWPLVAALRFATLTNCPNLAAARVTGAS